MSEAKFLAFKIKNKKRNVIKTSAKIGKSNSSKGKVNKTSNIITTVLIVIAIGVFGFSLYQIILMGSDYMEAQGEYKGLTQSAITVDENSKYFHVNYDMLKQTNSDFSGWIDIPGSTISYPMVYYSGDNDFYIRRTFEGQSKTAGSIFLDYRSDPTFEGRNTIIYGHRMNDNTMFASLKGYLKESYWTEHKEIHIYTEEGIRIYDVFSSYTASIEDECYTFGFASDDEYVNWLNTVKGKSNYSTGVSLDKNSKVILLSTCVYNEENNRNVVLAAYRETVPNV